MTEPCSQVAPPSREATVSIWVVRGLVHTVEQAGVPRDKLFRAAGLDPSQLDSPEARLPRWVVYRLCELATEFTADPALGLHWAESPDGSAFAPLSHLIAHAATLRQAFDALSQFQPLLSDHFGYERFERDNKVTVQCLNLPGESLAIQRFVAEMLVIGVWRLVRFFNPRVRVERVSFAYPAPAYKSEYTRVFDGAERFDEPFTGIVFDSAFMNAPSPSKDVDLHEALRSVAERRVLRLTERTPYAQRVRDVLVSLGSPHQSDMRAAARALGISVRSLRRRLAAEGKAYNAILKDACAIVAKRLLLDRRRTIQEAAYELGFSDTTAFHRAFKRWTGMTPSAFRQQELGGDTHE
jgi:AraC-like DNA-binding protein